MSEYGIGSASYAVAEPGSRAVEDFGPNRCCEKCGSRCHRYSKPFEGYLLCNRCDAARSRMDKTPAEFVGKGKRGRGSALKPGHGLPGLRATRLQAGLSQKALAALVGTNDSRVSALEQGSKNASAEFTARLAKALGVSVSALTGERRAA